ncbi:bifunctional lysylphosphatidylglycerol flippase/synthetase MprF [Longimicrobium sp.]|uniref:bifunctional lysylphosphatidylglycerol flippase/synthetase MprF n=1 Tax=Longimicrobium sp. TaxID=2029185 RepID=UPI002BD78F63|nr:bifunctional lysylphosphatidylglycerol flippase/synthetase MprF [Longimicrobium sp.]HSU15912.1 bifunctional lysylphosphatidylglycerol flippase/synthetase MprF [Longimicrobium sp.]
MQRASRWRLEASARIFPSPRTGPFTRDANLGKHKRKSGLQRLHALTPLFGIALFAFALWLLHRELRNYHYADLKRELRNLPHSRLLLAVALTLVSYAVMTLYDALGVRYVRRKLSYLRIAMASLVGYGISMTLGFPLLTGAPLRYRMYSRWGLTPGEIARIIGFYSTTFWLGVLSVGGLSFALDPPKLPPDFPVDPAWLRPLGWLMIVVLAAYLVLSALGTRIAIRGVRIELPSFWMAVAQVVSSSLDWVLAAWVMYALLPPNAPSFTSFFGIFLAGQILGHASHVPGGLGVFESVLLYFLTQRIPAPQVVGALLAYRAVYYLLPLGLAVLTLAGHELRRLKTRVAGPEPMAGWFSAQAPQVLAIATFVGGAILLFSVATPLDQDRLGTFRRVVPLVVSEPAHLLTAVVGVMLLLLARGVQMRLAAAWRLAVGMMAAGILFTLLKGLDWEEAAALAAMLIAMLVSRRRFHRRVPVLQEPFTPGWLVAAGVILIAAVWVGFFAYKHVEYNAGLWTTFGWEADAPRFMRALVAMSAVLVAFGVAHLARSPHAEPKPPAEDELAAARAIVALSPRADANLALLGDKPLMFNPARTAFLMFGVTGRSWVALGDPVGPAEEHEELVWRFREEADRRGAAPVFYETAAETRPLYADMGLALIKLGEEAVVELPGFSLEGDERRHPRRAWRQAHRHGVSFELVPAEGVAALVPELKAVSDEWLARRKAREMGFAMGRFDPAYLANFPHAVARLGGKVIAFATVWPAAEGTELAVDLVRWSRAAPPGIMEFLLVELMLWGRANGWRELSLGMAPLAGLAAPDVSPRAGALVFRHGEHFRDLHGLRRYKERFGAEWRPRYLAAPGGPELPRILAGIADLIAGNGREVRKYGSTKVRAGVD